MPLEHGLILISGGLAAGFLAGIIGVGGGIIFAPVLYFYFDAVGVDDAIIAPLVIGTSLLCTTLAAGLGSWFQHRRGAVNWKVASRVGLGAALAIVLVTRFITTQPWFDGDAFKVIFSVILAMVAVRMLAPGDQTSDIDMAEPRDSTLFHFATGSIAGVVSAMAGVGGGVVLVPSYQWMGLSMVRSIATSSGTIIFISLTGVVSYMLLGKGIPSASGFSVGFVDIGSALLIAIPAMFSVRLGVITAHRVNRQSLRKGFALIALIVVVRLLWSVFAT